MNKTRVLWILHCDEPSCDLGCFAYVCPSCGKTVHDYTVWFDFDDIVVKGKIVEFRCGRCGIALQCYFDSDEYATCVELVKQKEKE